MKKSIFIIAMTTTLVFSSCVNRKTDSDEIRLEDKTEKIAEDGTSQIETSDVSTNQKDLAEINSAKNQVNKYFEALNEGDQIKAYDEMSITSNRGTRSDFSEKNANVESVTANFTETETETPTVTTQDNNTNIKLPLRYTIKTKEGNTETYTGHATITKKGEDGDYKIEGMNVSKEDN
ncbi:NTF2-like N-terminal transpeptidase domain-containing protein [Leeuwenhoekiella sp. NPDC079379]|uniref:NTF2-like N-terminal transpeptidase domain-containing protein n=1 Tax=Leeuwenhoekiella sp. NPDC079379 TaxID=3364122 RepID=UPI0037CA8321